jgi:hypothetical protein
LRRLLKFLHTMGAIGMIGAMACLLVLAIFAPPPDSLAGYALMYGAMAKIATWILLPSLAMTLIAGMLAIAWNRAFHDAGWAWVKLATGVLIFEGGLVYVQGPINEEAERSASVVVGHLPAAELGSYGAQQGTLWVLLAVGIANVVLGVWRPRLRR